MSSRRAVIYAKELRHRKIDSFDGGAVEMVDGGEDPVLIIPFREGWQWWLPGGVLGVWNLWFKIPHFSESEMKRVKHGS